MIFDRLPAERAYRSQLAVFGAMYVALIVVAERIDFTRDFRDPVLPYVVAAAPAVPIIGMMLAVLKLMARSDEFVRALMAKRFIVATGLVYAAGTVWGFLELYAGAPDAPLYLIFAAFWLAFGLTSPFIKSTR